MRRNALFTQRAIEQMGYRVIRFWNHEVLTATDDVATAIFNAIHPAPAGPASRDQPPAGCLGTA